MTGHGDRPRAAADEQQVAAIRQAGAARLPLAADLGRLSLDLA
jgi:hypothetical protein